MEASEILEKITSRDGHKVWASACAIIEESQSRDKIAPLTEYVDHIKEQTAGLSLGGALAPNKRFVDYALRVLEFHKNNSGCTCALYTDSYEGNNPGNEEKKGNVDILEVVRMEDGWVDYYACGCLRCGQNFNVIEREYHYTWWQWERV